MAVQIFTAKDFKSMLWKNGGGSTIELYRISSQDEHSFSFRLSMAAVQSSGAFSIFPGIDRILLLMEGRGFYLEGAETKASLKLETPPISFKGEEVIKYELIDGPCIDFNVMTHRKFATSQVFLEKFISKKAFKAESDLKFIYNKEAHELYKMDLGDTFDFVSNGHSNLIIIDVNYL
jgi:environmental stress-induced protein Ves